MDRLAAHKLPPGDTSGFLGTSPNLSKTSNWDATSVAPGGTRCAARRQRKRQGCTRRVAPGERGHPTRRKQIGRGPRSCVVPSGVRSLPGGLEAQVHLATK
ncbi:hypothetical protein DEO72_LG4g910 [Vigna unguiculata]|uniref:Uncharacterized protein n=1 Tax=Vigna unguiculata TaxID=3917 RepID=A0A4D6LNC2_VIGUN|nr:hypothetical protein DEO72_LG4g910 [Vigna unguiculata]